MKSPQPPVDDRPALLIVEDEILLLQTLAIFLESRGFNVSPTASVREAQTRYWSRPKWDVIISDYHLPDGTGLDFCSWVREQAGAMPPFLIMSGGIKGDGIVGVEFLAKPFNLEQLERRVRTLRQGGKIEPGRAVGG